MRQMMCWNWSLCSHCRCAVASWSVCVTWAGQERTVTPRLLSVIWWSDPQPQFQVQMSTLSLSLSTPPLFICTSSPSSPFILLSCPLLSSLHHFIAFSSSFKIPPIQKCYVEYFKLFLCFFVALFIILESRVSHPLIKTSRVCIHWTMHVILFVCHYFHTHSLSTGRCLWRSDLRSDLSSFSLC